MLYSFGQRGEINFGFMVVKLKANYCRNICTKRASQISLITRLNGT